MNKFVIIILISSFIFFISVSIIDIFKEKNNFIDINKIILESNKEATSDLNFGTQYFKINNDIDLYKLKYKNGSVFLFKYKNQLSSLYIENK